MSRRVWLLGGLFLALAGLLLALPPSDERQPTLSVYSAAPSGGKALRLWLEALGYPVAVLEGDRDAVGPEVGVLLVLGPTRPIDRVAADQLERWTRQGGRLVVVDEGYRASELLRRFGVGAHVLGAGIVAAVPAPGSRLDPAIRSLPAEPRSGLLLRPEATGAEPWLLGTTAAPAETAAEGAASGAGAATEPAAEAPAPPTPEDGPDGESVASAVEPAAEAPPEQPAPASGRPVLAARVPAGRGELLVLTVPDLLGNAALHDEANARLALSLVGPPGRGLVAFDELHHGFGAARTRSLYALLLDHAWGRTFLLAAALVLLFLLWRGRRFGRAVPLVAERRRSLGELVTSLAALYRAGAKRAFAAEHLARQLRQEIGQALGLPVHATDDEIAARARMLGRDPSEALRVLAALPRAHSDRELLALARAGLRARAALARAPARERQPDAAGDRPRARLSGRSA